MHPLLQALAILAGAYLTIGIITTITFDHANGNTTPPTPETLAFILRWPAVLHHMLTHMRDILESQNTPPDNENPAPNDTNTTPPPP